jgi:hypothetical protein
VILEPDNKKPDSGFSRFYSVRRRVYGGMLLFVIVAGLSLAAVPAFRHRLAERIHVLKAAFTGETAPLMMQAGENNEPFPAEYERQFPPSVAQTLKLPATPIPYAELPKEETPARGPARRTLRIPPVREDLSSSGEEEEARGPGESVPADDLENQPDYRQGTIEKEAYDLLLNSKPSISGLVNGSDPSLQFLSWDAAGRGDGIYWVRLRFRSGQDPEIKYIWQVQLESKQITPLNYNARSLP